MIQTVKATGLEKRQISQQAVSKTGDGISDNNNNNNSDGYQWSRQVLCLW